MTKKIALVLCVILVGSFVTGCGESLMFWKKKKEIEVSHQKLPPFKTLFERTVEMYNSKQYKDAINSFLFLRENYPQETAYQSRITLYLADSHFHQKEYPEAIANYREFIKLYPTSPDVPYAYFQIGMCNYKERRTYDRDATFVRKAIENFKKVLQIAPPGVLVNESIRMIALCQRELALHDLFIADFYMRTHHYKSAIFRYEDVLHSFPDFKIYDRAHLGIGKAYLKLKKRNEAFRHLSYVAKNYPNTPYGKEAWKLLQKDFKVASRDQLPDVTFPMANVASATPPAPATKPVPSPAPEKATASTKTAGGKQVKTNAPASTTPPAKVAKKPAPEPKPHTYFPKITKVQEKPAVSSPPVKTVKSSEPQTKVVKTTPQAKEQTRNGTTSKAAPAPKTPPVSPPLKHVKKPTPAPPAPQHVATASTSPTPPTPHKTVTAKKVAVKKPSQPKPVSAVPASPKTQETPVPQKPSEEKAAPQKPVQAPAASMASKPASPAPPPKKAAQKAAPPATAVQKSQPPTGKATPSPAVKKAEKTPSNVKKMVKTDTLPPKKVKQPSSGLVGALDTRKPIHITADHVESQQGKNSVRFYGRVVAKQKDVTLKCDDLTAFYTSGGKAIDKIVAHGHVVITQLNKKVKCGKAIFYNAARKIILEDSPIAWDGNNRISGSKMVLLLDKNEIQILGSKKKPTELVIYPNQKPGLLKSPAQSK